MKQTFVVSMATVCALLVFGVNSIALADSNSCGSQSLNTAQASNLSAFFQKYKTNLSNADSFKSMSVTPDSTVAQMKQQLCQVLAPFIVGPCSPSSLFIWVGDSKQNGGALKIVLKNPDRGFLVIAPGVNNVLQVASQPMSANSLQACKDEQSDKSQPCELKWLVGSLVSSSGSKDTSSRKLVAGAADEMGAYTGCMADGNGAKSFSTRLSVYRCPCPEDLNFSNPSGGESYSISIPLNGPIKMTGPNGENYIAAELSGIAAGAGTGAPKGTEDPSISGSAK